MKTALILSLALAVSGCASTGSQSAIQTALDRALPPGFTGNATVEHKNPYFDVTINAKGLRREGDTWRWDSLEYLRNGRVSHGRVTLSR